MNDQQKTAAQAARQAAETNRKTFPEIVGALTEAGFESYTVDYRRATTTYYLPNGESLELPAHRISAEIAPGLNADQLQAAIREAQQQVPGYSYRGFSEKAALAGCAGYIVSFSGRRALYFARTAETHLERFPD